MQKPVFTPEENTIRNTLLKITSEYYKDDPLTAFDITQKIYSQIITCSSLTIAITHNISLLPPPIDTLVASKLGINYDTYKRFLTLTHRIINKPQLPSPTIAQANTNTLIIQTAYQIAISIIIHMLSRKPPTLSEKEINHKFKQTHEHPIILHAIANTLATDLYPLFTIYYAAISTIIMLIKALTITAVKAIETLNSLPKPLRDRIIKHYNLKAIYTISSSLWTLQIMKPAPTLIIKIEKDKK